MSNKLRKQNRIPKQCQQYHDINLQHRCKNKATHITYFGKCKIKDGTHYADGCVIDDDDPNSVFHARTRHYFDYFVCDEHAFEDYNWKEARELNPNSGAIRISKMPKVLKNEYSS